MSQHVGRGLLCAAVGLLWPMAALAQVSIEPPPSPSSPPAAAPAPTPAPEPQIQPPPPEPNPAPSPDVTDETPRAAGATQPAAAASSSSTTQPSAQAVLENLLSTRPSTAEPAPVPAGGTTAAAGLQGNSAAPNEPVVKRKPEGDFVWNAVGRLTRDDQTGEWLFVFDSDGKRMQDPPMGLVPSRMLMAMQQASKDGTVPTKFRVSGEVTEYNGKNYLYVKDERVVQDLNQGIGG
ncbi:MAG TPA: hypothetical protein VHQ47_14160 [Phycisphaerae bacterium]|nr:hypothetical protein [Phycisphaerae bacterium]